MPQAPHIYPLTASGATAEPGKEYFPRRDAALTADQLGQLLGADPDRWLAEWSYRVPDLVDSVGDVGDFLESLMLRYISAICMGKQGRTGGVDIGKPTKVRLVEHAVGCYRRGNRSLQQTCLVIRCGLAGKCPEMPSPKGKDDPELRHAITNVFKAIGVATPRK